MKRRKEPLNMSTSGFLDEAHDYFDPDIMRRYREALAESDLEGGRLAKSATTNTWFKYTVKDGVFSEWNGHRPNRFEPFRVSVTYCPTTSSIGFLLFSSSRNAGGNGMRASLLHRTCQAVGMKISEYV